MNKEKIKCKCKKCGALYEFPVCYCKNCEAKGNDIKYFKRQNE